MNTKPITVDVVVVGAGVAGLSTALALSPLSVALVSKARFGFGGSSPYAQGGIAAAVGADDEPSLHAEDTMTASAGLAVRDVVDVLVKDGPVQVERLLALGTRFDRKPDGGLMLGREAAHSRRRILHARGDCTGAEIVRAMSAAVQEAPHISILEETFAHDLALDRQGNVVGLACTERSGKSVRLKARAVVLATGGIGQLYARTTNPAEVTGDGLAMALRAGAKVCDVEFVQFHPTALASDRDPSALLTEALRGEGATLLNDTGERFMPKIHPDAELAPRDVVARSIWNELNDGRTVYLHANTVIGPAFPERFPTVFALAKEAGFDARTEPLPVSPAAHYHMGGIDVDVNGRSSLNGLWACGETSATGVHGANRLASNSLLEGLVFGSRCANNIVDHVWSQTGQNAPEHWPVARVRRAENDAEAKIINEIRTLMWKQVGLVRQHSGLCDAMATLDTLAQRCDPSWGEASNMLEVASAVVAAALLRRESRGGHYRVDFPLKDEGYKRRLSMPASELMKESRMFASPPLPIPSATHQTGVRV